MKKLAIILVLMFTSILPLRAHAQSANWVALQSDSTSLNAVGQTINLSLNAMLDSAINGASLILRYDPACYKISGHQPGSLLPGATSFVQDQPGQLDLTYYFQGQGKGLTGAGSLITIQLETLQLCSTDLSIAPETLTLGVLDNTGMAFNLSGVELRSLIVHLVPASGLPITTPQQAAALPANSPAASALAPLPTDILNPDSTWFWIGMSITGLLALALILISVFSFRSGRRIKVSQKTMPVRGAALMNSGRSIPLPRRSTRLGRHIEIMYENGKFYVADKGSRLGVFLNGNRVGAGNYPLRHGDKVQLGGEISYQFIDARAESAQPG